MHTATHAQVNVVSGLVGIYIVRAALRHKEDEVLLPVVWKWNVDADEDAQRMDTAMCVTR